MAILSSCTNTNGKNNNIVLLLLVYYTASCTPLLSSSASSSLTRSSVEKKSGGVEISSFQTSKVLIKNTFWFYSYFQSIFVFLTHKKPTVTISTSST